MDKEYIILDIIDKHEYITQREISQKTNLSLGSVNLLLNKMAHDGMIKLKEIPMNRVAYMLTPKGMSEKVSKTYTYIKTQYNYINETKEKMKKLFIKLRDDYKEITILLEEDEITELVKTAALEVKGIELVSNETDLSYDRLVVTLNTVKTESLKECGFKTLNLIELL